MDKIDPHKSVPALKTASRKRFYKGEMPGIKNTPQNQYNKKHLKAYLAGKGYFNGESIRDNRINSKPGVFNMWPGHKVQQGFR